MRSPELLPSSRDHQTVKFVAWQGKLKGESPEDQSEEHNAQGKYISGFGIILLGGVLAALMNFRGHVASPGALEGGEVVLSGWEHGSKAEVCKFGSDSLRGVGDEDVVEFDVPMNNRVTVQVHERLSNLPKDQPSFCNCQCFLFDEVEQVAVSSVLLSEETIITRPCREGDVLPETIDLHDVLVHQLAQNSPLILQMLHLLHALLPHCLQYHLQLLLLQQQDLRVAPFPQQRNVLSTELHKNYNRIPPRPILTTQTHSKIGNGARIIIRLLVRDVIRLVFIVIY